MSVSERDRDRLLFAIGRSASDPAIWTEILPDIARYCGGWGAQLVGGYRSSAGVIPVYHHSNFEPENVAHWIDLGGLDPRLNPRTRIMLRPSSFDILADGHFAEKDEINKNPLFNEVYEKIDVQNMLTSLYYRNQDLGNVVAVFRSKRQGAFEMESSARLRDLLPHLAASMELRLWFENKGAQLQLDALELVSVPAIVVTVDARIVGANAPAESLMRSSPHLEVRNGRLATADPTSAMALASAISAATAPVDRAVGRRQVSRVRVSMGDSPAMVLRVAPIPSDSHAFHALSAAIILIETSSGGSDQIEHRLSIFSFTPAERRLARGLLAGLRLNDYAERSGLSLNTVRNQLRSLFSKTQTSRQIELINKILGN